MSLSSSRPSSSDVSTTLPSVSASSSISTTSTSENSIPSSLPVSSEGTRDSARSRAMTPSPRMVSDIVETAKGIRVTALPLFGHPRDTSGLVIPPRIESGPGASASSSASGGTSTSSTSAGSGGSSGSGGSGSLVKSKATKEAEKDALSLLTSVYSNFAASGRKSRLSTQTMVDVNMDADSLGLFEAANTCLQGIIPVRHPLHRFKESGTSS